MQCATCGGTEFEFEGDSSPVRCIGCDRIYLRDDLVRENGAHIEAEIEDAKTQIIKDISKDFSKIFKNLK
jgi:ribosomal protein S27E